MRFLFGQTNNSFNIEKIPGCLNFTHWPLPMNHYCMMLSRYSSPSTLWFLFSSHFHRGDYCTASRALKLCGGGVELFPPHLFFPLAPPLLFFSEPSEVLTGTFPIPPLLSPGHATVRLHAKYIQEFTLV